MHHLNSVTSVLLGESNGALYFQLKRKGATSMQMKGATQNICSRHIGPIHGGRETNVRFSYNTNAMCCSSRITTTTTYAGCSLTNLGGMIPRYPPLKIYWTWWDDTWLIQLARLKHLLKCTNRWKGREINYRRIVFCMFECMRRYMLVLIPKEDNLGINISSG